MTGATQRKKQAILDAASVLFSERGVAGTGIEAIAELAQVSRQSVYTYYTSKEGILQALLESFYQRGAGQWLSEHAEAPPIRSRERLEEELFSFMASGIHALMNPDYLRLMRIVVSESEANPGLGDEFRRTVAGPMMEAIRSILSRVERQPAPDDLDRFCQVNFLQS